MNGIICINKPQEYTSFDVVARIRGMSKTKRVGHSGTLDPLATGVLPIFIGNATKACDVLKTDDKSYIATFQLGVTTNTLDVSGEILCKRESHVSKSDVLQFMPNFLGDIQQIPPMFSAVRVGGQRLYDIARQGREVKREPRPVTIFTLDLLEFDESKQTGQLFIECSKGTYIRTIISDLGELLKVGGIMTALCRSSACGFTLKDCMTLEQVQELTKNGELEGHLLPVDRMFNHLPKIELSETQSKKFKNGVKLDLNRLEYADIQTFHRVYDSDKEFIGLASLDKSDMALVIEKMFYQNPEAR